MIVFPAVDIQNGKAVRLLRGKKDQSVTYSDNPAEMAAKWREQGAEWLHLIDLDGAFEGGAANARAIDRIFQEIDIPIQIGGGIRTVEIAEKYIEAGAARLIIGTAALEDPALFKEMCCRFPGKVGVSLDAEAGVLKTRGWAASSNLKISEALPRITDSGASFLIYTDIERDGAHAGPNLRELEEVLKISPLPVIAAGGVSTIKDIENLAALKHYENLEGVITGRALCDNTLSLSEAIKAAR